MVRRLEDEGLTVWPPSTNGTTPSSRFDVTDQDQVESCVREARPDCVVHLAGKTYLPEVLADQGGAFRVNVLGTQNVLSAVRKFAPEARVVLVSSCTVYGAPSREDLPLRETAPLRALHPYGVQKVGAETLGEIARDDWGLDVVIARPFNHIGPGMRSSISVAHFARQIAAFEASGEEPVLRVGNLLAKRDFLDVRDVVEAYWRMLLADSPPPVMNVCSGESVSIQDMLDRLRGQSTVKTRVEVDTGRLRPGDVPDLFGSHELIRSALGWAPSCDLNETLKAILDHARSMAGMGAS